VPLVTYPVIDLYQGQYSVGSYLIRNLPIALQQILQSILVLTDTVDRGLVSIYGDTTRLVSQGNSPREITGYLGMTPVVVIDPIPISGAPVGQ
jgi:hypothetical protein